jgi:hypothetical protein
MYIIRFFKRKHQIIIFLHNPQMTTTVTVTGKRQYSSSSISIFISCNLFIQELLLISNRPRRIGDLTSRTLTPGRASTILHSPGIRPTRNTSRRQLDARILVSYVE